MKTVGYVGPSDALMKSWMTHIWQRYFAVRKETDILAVDYFEKSIAYSRYKHPNLFYSFAEDWIKNGDFYRRRTAFPVVMCHSTEEIFNTMLDVHRLFDNVPFAKENPSDSNPSGIELDVKTSFTDPREPKQEYPSRFPHKELDFSHLEDIIPANIDDDDLGLYNPFDEAPSDTPPLIIKQDALRLDYIAELLFTCQTADSFAGKAADVALYNLPSPVTVTETVVYSVVRRLVEIAAIAALREWTAYLEDWKYDGKPEERLTWYFYRRLSDIADLLKEGDGKERNKIARRSDNHIWLWIPDLTSEFNSMLKYARNSDGTVRGLLLQIYEGKKDTVFEKTKLNAAFMGGTAMGTVLVLDKDPYKASHLPWIVNSLACYQDAIFIALELDKWTKRELEFLEKAVLADGTDNLFVWTAADDSKVPKIFKDENVMTPDGFNTGSIMYPAPKFISYTEKVVSETEEDEKFLNKTVRIAERLKKLYESELVIGCISQSVTQETNTKEIRIPYEEMPENLIVKARRLIFKIKGEDPEKANHPYKCAILN